MRTQLADWQALLWSVAGVLIAIAAGSLAHITIFRTARRFSRNSQSILAQGLLFCEKPAHLILVLTLEMIVISVLPIRVALQNTLRHIVGICLIIAAAWLLIALVDVIEAVLGFRYSSEVADDLAARRVRTQVQVLRRIIVMMIVVVTIAGVLMTFPSIRHIGESLFASAGIAAVVAGLAARTMLSNLLAGVQIALTQPIRLEDVVIVEGEWGWIEEITTTFVVVRVWDLRRLVVPISYFIEKPFQNWTRKSADLLGTVFIYADYTISVDEVRRELHRVLQTTDLWDGKVWGLQVTNATDRTLELRALMSATSSARAWDLRCFVREKLIQFLQERFPDCLPKTRADLNSAGSQAEEGRFKASINAA